MPSTFQILMTVVLMSIVIDDYRFQGRLVGITWVNSIDPADDRGHSSASRDVPKG